MKNYPVYNPPPLVWDYFAIYYQISSYWKNRYLRSRLRLKPRNKRLCVENFDVVIVGAGAAGLFCAAQAGQLGLR
ncbi:MAG: NAD(P)/FAD-dependent oxidoreductase, partial [Enterobacterales bacterium]|nr:NAD(P)/FAD-dependent oxidoreductase [Enterobacterales bacterium]